MAAYFAFRQATPNGEPVEFILELRDEGKIATARSILSDPASRRKHVQGTIVSQPAPYNPKWSYHLDPATIDFFEIQTEVCDANATYVEDHLDEIGGSTLPEKFWCPWSSRLSRELLLESTTSGQASPVDILEGVHRLPFVSGLSLRIQPYDMVTFDTPKARPSCWLEHAPAGVAVHTLTGPSGTYEGATFANEDEGLRWARDRLEAVGGKVLRATRYGGVHVRILKTAGGPQLTAEGLVEPSFQLPGDVRTKWKGLSPQEVRSAVLKQFGVNGHLLYALVGFGSWDATPSDILGL